MLVPAGVLVLVVLAAITVDSAIAFMAQRELAGLATGAANDAAAALREEAFYQGPGQAVSVDPELARRVATQAANRPVPGVEGLTVAVATRGPVVCVTVRGQVRFVFARAVPGAAQGTEVTGRAVATAVEGAAGTPVPPGDC